MRTYLNLLRISSDLFAWPTPDLLAKDQFIYSLPRHEAKDQAESPKQSWQQSRAVPGVESPQQTPGISEIDKNQSNRPQWVDDLLKAIQGCLEQSLP